jgi:hypothetical protein
MPILGCASDYAFVQNRLREGQVGVRTDLTNHGECHGNEIPIATRGLGAGQADEHLAGLADIARQHPARNDGPLLHRLSLQHPRVIDDGDVGAQDVVLAAGKYHGNDDRACRARPKDGHFQTRAG